MGYYQLLGKPMPFCVQHYRGVYRCGPNFQGEIPETASVNQAWREYVDSGEKLLNREQALRLANIFRQAGHVYDVVNIEVMSNPPTQDLPGQLGFDVCIAGWYSLLSWGLRWDGYPSPKGPLLALLEAYFRPLLNEYGLFAQWSDARFFLDVVQALSTLLPGIFESENNIALLEIVRLIDESSQDD